MQNSNNNGGFEYTYSAKEQAELKKIRDKYTHKEREEEDKLTRLRRLDAGVTNKAQAVSLTLGIIGTLILGLGMSFIMSELGSIFGDRRIMAITVGIITGIIGGAVAGVAYPIYSFVLKRERAKVAEEVLRLTDELIK